MRRLTSSLLISAIVLLMAIIPTPPTQAQSQFQPGDVIVAEQGRSRLVVVHPDGSTEVIIANLQDPRGVALEENGSILVVEQSGNRVSRVSFSNNRFRRDTVRGNLNVPEGIALDTSGRILVTNFGDGRLLRLSSDGRQLETLVMGLSGPSGVAVSPDGEIFVAELNAGQISEVASDGSSRRVVVEGLRSPDQMALADTGLLYVTEFGPGRLTEVNPDTGETRVIASGLNAPVGVAVGPSSASLTKTAQTPVGDAVYVTNNPGTQGQNGELVEVDSRTGSSMVRARVNNGAGCGAVPFRQPVRVQFRQLNWLGEGDDILAALSRIIALKLIFSRFATPLLEENGGGYVNVVTALPGGGAPQWSVQNLYLRYPHLAYMLSSCPILLFGLPINNGTPVNEIMYDISITPMPLTEPPGLPTRPMLVRPADYRFGGIEDGGSGFARLPFILGPWIGPQPPIIPPRRVALTFSGGGALPKVNEDKNGCAPAGAARSIKYMLDAAGTAAPPVQDIYNSLRGTMMTGANGTGLSNILPGKDAYAANNNLSIHSGMLNAGVEGAVEEAMDTLDEGGDVELIILWDSDGDGDVDSNDKGGHMAMVTGMVLYGNGQYQLSFVDDAKQGDGKAENNEHVIMVNPDGTFNANPVTGLSGGRIFGFVMEALGGSKMSAVPFSPSSGLATSTASDPATRFVRSSPFGQLVDAVGFPVSIRPPVGVSPSFFLAPSRLGERDVSRPVARSPRKFIN